MVVYLGLLAIYLGVVAILQFRYRSAVVTTLTFVFYWLLVFIAPLFLSPSTFTTLNMLCYGVFFGGTMFCVILAFSFRNNNRVLAVVSLLFSIFLLSIAAYAFIFEPKWLDVRYESMSSTKIKKKIRIVVLADIQTDQVGSFEARVLDTTKKLNPDLIVLPGDYIQEINESKRNSQLKILRDIFEQKKLEAPLGVYATQGDMESYSDWLKLFEGLPIEAFSESSTIESQFVAITGLTLLDSDVLRYEVPKSDKFHIVVGHRPDFFLAKSPGDLLIAGHTHGGQIQIPFFGPPKTLTKVPRNWAKGCFVKRGEQYLLISRGIGMERSGAPPIRFWCRPEIVVVDVSPGTDI